MKYNKIDFYLIFLACQIFLITSAPQNGTLCTQRTSDNDKYVLECLIPDQATLKQLPDLVKSVQIHGDDDEVRNLNLELVDEFYLSGQMTILSHNSFSWLPNLRKLTIDNHQGTILTHETTFGGLRNLTSIILITKFAPNSVVPGEVFPDSLRKIGASLEELQILDADLKGELGKKNMKYFPNLKALTIVNSPKLKISDEEGIFGKMEKVDLRRISMGIFPKSISILKGLKILRLENVQLTNFPQNSLSNLRELYIGNNSISILDPKIFQGMKSLKILTITKTAIKHLPDHIFDDLIKLDELNLSGNRLESLPDGLFRHCGRLGKIDLSKNLIGNVSGGIFSGLEISLMHLDLSDNRIRAFRVSNLSDQLSVSLARNGIDQLKNGFFQSGAMFNRLIMNGNPLNSMESGAFGGISIGSGDLYMQKTNMTWLDLAVFHGMKSDGQDEQAIYVSGCPNLVGLEVGNKNIQWPNGIKQVVFADNPKFVLAEHTQDAYFPDLAKLVKKSGVQFVMEGKGLCNCRWNWLRSGKFARKEEQSAVVSFGGEDSAAAMCCNIIGMGMEEFLEKENFEKHCNGTVPMTKEGAVESCPGFDGGEGEEPEARKK